MHNSLGRSVRDRIADYSRKIELFEVYSNQVIMEITLNQYIEMTPGVREVKPQIAGAGMRVADIATLSAKMGKCYIYRRVVGEL